MNDHAPTSVPLPYRDRAAGGRALAAQLKGYANRSDVLVLALPRGGVPVGFEVARALKAPLDVFVVRKLGVPGHEELAMGALASGGALVLNDEVVGELRIAESVVTEIAEREKIELERRESLYRGDRDAPDVQDKTVILVDDGLATGATMRAGARSLRQLQPARLVIGVPVASAETCDSFGSEADEIVCAFTPRPFYAVGLWYQQFDQTSDDEVRALLAQNQTEHSLL